MYWDQIWKNPFIDLFMASTDGSEFLYWDMKSDENLKKKASKY